MDLNDVHKMMIEKTIEEFELEGIGKFFKLREEDLYLNIRKVFPEITESISLISLNREGILHFKENSGSLFGEYRTTLESLGYELVNGIYTLA